MQAFGGQARETELMIDPFGGPSSREAETMKHTSDRFPERKRPAHIPIVETGNLSTIIFLTICTRGRRPLLARPEAARTILQSLNMADSWSVGRYVIMPDHIHLFCAPGTWPPHPLQQWIRYWQNIGTRAWPWPKEKPVWQKDYWDRQLRGGESYAAKWDYVRSNPVRHKLVEDAAEWPYQGELRVLHWHDA